MTDLHTSYANARDKSIDLDVTPVTGTIGAVVNGVRFYDSPTCHHRPEVCGGILETECGEILKRFFRNKRRKV